MKRINEIIDFCDSSLSCIGGLIETNTPTNKADIMSILTDLYIGAKNAKAWFEKMMFPKITGKIIRHT